MVPESFKTYNFFSCSTKYGCYLLFLRNVMGLFRPDDTSQGLNTECGILDHNGYSVRFHTHIIIYIVVYTFARKHEMDIL